MSQEERELIATAREWSRVHGYQSLPQLSYPLDALERRLDAEVGDGEIAKALARLESDTSDGKPWPNKGLMCDVKTLCVGFRQLLAERDEARKAFGDLVKIEAQGLARINGLEAQVKELEGDRETEGVFPIDWDAVRKQGREKKP